MLLSGAIVTWIEWRGTDRSLAPTGVIDAALGFALVAGLPSPRPFALFRAWGGLVLFSLIALVNRNWLELAIQVPFSVGLIFLLQKEPRPRLAPWAAGVPALVLVAVAVASAFGVRERARLDRESLPVEARLRGRSLPYSIEVPRSGWRLLRPETSDEYRKGTDRWLINPARHANLYVEGFRLEQKDISLDKLEALRTKELGDEATNLEVLPTPGFPPRSGRSRLLHYRRLIQGQQFEVFHALIAKGPAAFEMKAWVPVGGLEDPGSDELRAIILSFDFEEG